MARKAALFGILALSALMAFSQDRKGGLVEGEKWAFLVSAPEGWVWDSSSLRHQGIWGLFYKEGGRFSPTRLHIYISPSQKRPGGPASLREFIEADEATYMKSNPGNRIVDLPPYAPGLDYQFALRDFDDPGEGYYQSIAYYEGEDVFLVFVLLCRGEAERDGARAAFLELLDSFTYMHKD
jgi:hypothetical protein